jgi:hypothetical protein
MEAIKQYLFVVLDSIFTLWGFVLLFVILGLVYFWIENCRDKKWYMDRHDELIIAIRLTNDIKRLVNVKIEADVFGYRDIAIEANEKIRLLRKIKAIPVVEITPVEDTIESPLFRKIRIDKDEV